MEKLTILKFISILQRNTNRYFDLMLDKTGIGSGQQFFLLRIYENKDITMVDLSRLGSFDKGTVTKAVQKLVDNGYVKVVVDSDDRRVRHLRTTKKALPVIDEIYKLRDTWLDSLQTSMTDEEKKNFLDTLSLVADHSSNTISRIIEEKSKS